MMKITHYLYNAFLIEEGSAKVEVLSMDCSILGTGEQLVIS